MNTPEEPTSPEPDTATTTFEAVSEQLQSLARVYGVSTDYRAFNGDRADCSASAVRAALKAMGVDASSDEACEAALAKRDEDSWKNMLPKVTVARYGTSYEISVHALEGAAIEVTLTLESGAHRTLHQVSGKSATRVIGAHTIERTAYKLSGDLPLGYHSINADAGSYNSTASVIVVPERLEVPDGIRETRPWGFMAQLYSVRSKASWGFGDFADLRDLCALAGAKAHADFMLINPLHAAEPVSPITPSPYLPTSRRFVNPLYIRVEDIDEVAYMPVAERSLIDWKSDRPRTMNADAGEIDRDAVWKAKSAALEHIFTQPLSPGRQALFEAYRARQGKGLEDFATWCAIDEEHAGTGKYLWPSKYATPDAPEVVEFRRNNGDRVRYYAWLQWIADQQLASAQAAAQTAGMSIGIMNDLAVGVHPTGADAWALGSVHARGIGVGAPPDMYNQQGQNWSPPPWLPGALADVAYRPFREMVRASLRHVGALRIDHIMGLFRLWWVPQDHSADDGVYVTYDHEAMVGILALEAERAGAIVIGEDLGTVEPWVRDYLQERGILGTTVMWFEKDDEGHALDPRRGRADVLATVTTHDLPPTAAYLAGEHVDLREDLGLLVRPASELRAEAREERKDMVELLRRKEWLTVEGDASERDIVEAMHRAVMASPALLTGVALTDAVGDRRAQNQPGTDRQYPNWKMPLTNGDGAVVLLDDLFDNPRLLSLVSAVRKARD